MGFSYNDITSKSMGLKARLTSWQVSGRLRNFTTTVPGKYGVTDFGADFDYREIVVSCSIFPRHSFPALVSTLDDIAAWLDPVGGLKQLILDDVPDRYFMARLNAAVECERLLRSSGSFDLTFFCPDPFGYAIEDENCSLETRTAFPSSTTRTWIPWSTGQTRRRTAGSSGGCVCGLWVRRICGCGNGCRNRFNIFIFWESATAFRSGRFFHTQNQEEVTT